jgi:hypothetical protein
MSHLLEVEHAGSGSRDIAGQTRDAASRWSSWLADLEADSDPAIDLDSQRWGPAVRDQSGGICIPAGTWQHIVSGWPHAQWLAWHRRVTELTPWGVTVEQIREAQHRAYLETIDAGHGD